MTGPSAAANIRVMIVALYRPLPTKAVVLVASGLIAGTALYCLSYNAFGGRSESLTEAVLWACVNVIPWYLAFEAAKRQSSKASAAGSFTAALASSMLLHILFFGVPSAVTFELLRRVPALLLVVALLATGRLLVASRAAPTAVGEGVGLPLAPSQFDWVSAAGNYVELHAQGRAVIHRAPLSLVHQQLERHGFVRIHRSTLVRRQKIARVRAGDVVLQDGTSLKTGKRYRSGLTPH